MKVLVIGLGLVFGGLGVFRMYVSLVHVHDKALEAQRVEAQAFDLEQKILLLKKLRQQPAQALDEAYAAFRNDMGLIARAHRVTFTASLVGVNDADIGKSACPSAFSGLREVRLHGIFSGLGRRVTLLSLLDALAAFEGTSPVVFQDISREKDALAFDLTVIGL